MRQREKELRHAFLQGYRAGRRYKGRQIDDMFAAALKEYDARLDARREDFEQSIATIKDQCESNLAAIARNSLHRLQEIGSALFWKDDPSPPSLH